ncbi:MAG: IclR family transcriptional regulator [Negativicutes bacterium]|nr:IclR family transcriptional regulator [Negativicutes bacterium]MDR3591217.1 IclR family transcriptional regulator [Negativicutes bacterium]
MKQDDLQNTMINFSSLKSLQIIMALSTNLYTSIAELAKITGLNKSTVHRILNELAECDFVVKDEIQKKFRLGYQIISLATKIQLTDYLFELSKDKMKYLNDLSGETISLVALNHHEGVYVGKVEAKNQIALRFKVGWKLPLYCTSSGKAILANQNTEFLDSYFSNIELKKYTENTIVDQSRLEAEFETIRKQGFAMDIMEHNPDIICISAPIFLGNKQCIGTIGIVAPSYRFSKEKALSFKNDLTDVAQKITEQLSSM